MMNNKTFKIRFWLMLSLLVTNHPFVANAQHSSDYAIHANIIYHFTKYIDWPEYRKNGDFVIGVVGDSPIYDELKRIMINKIAGSQRIVIRRVTASQAATDCHILFISEDESGSLKKICSKTSNEPVLLVCEEEGTAARGACIDFRLVSDRLKLEVNRNNIEQRQMNIANELLRLAILVK